MKKKELTPKKIVKELNKYIVGQDNAKKAVAIALRNRYRRKMLPPELSEEILPKNILMIGSTGVGKTEIARRLADLVKAPFIKVEATKYTEVGYVGRDVESIIRDLVEISVRSEKKKASEKIKKNVENEVLNRITELLLAKFNKQIEPEFKPKTKDIAINFPEDLKKEIPKMELEKLMTKLNDKYPSDPESIEVYDNNKFEELKEEIKQGIHDDEYIELKMPETHGAVVEVISNVNMEDMGFQLPPAIQNLMSGRKKNKKIKVKRAKIVFNEEETDKQTDTDEIVAQGIKNIEQTGIVFIDEIDKIIGPDSRSSGPEVSREGVQRDLLPLIEGTTVITKYGPVKTHHILFIAAGAFHNSKPNDLIPELQGRFPIRVELDSLNWKDFLKILTEPKNALVNQYKGLLSVEGIELKFNNDALKEISKYADSMNKFVIDIGARRLYTIVEKVLEEVSFNASEMKKGKFEVNADIVKKKLKELDEEDNLNEYIL